MSSVTNSTIINQPTLNTKAVLESKVGTDITDPKSGSRTSNNNFIMTSRPRKNPLYPVIVIDTWLGPGEILGKLASLKYPIQQQVTVFAKDSKNLDEIMGQVLNVMKAEKAIFDGYGMRRANPYLQGLTPKITDNDNVHYKAATYNFVYYAM